VEDLNRHFTQDDIMLYIENPKDTTRKLLKLINEFINSNITGYKINTQKSLPFLYTNNKKSERRQKTLYVKNYDTDEINKKQYKQIERYIMFLDWNNQCHENDHTTQNNVQIYCNPCNANYKWHFSQN